MKTNMAGVALIKRWESLRLKAYLCPARRWTIGYGHTGKMMDGTPVREGVSITPIEAERLLCSDLAIFERGVETLVAGVEVTENQFAALVSFAFNLGVEALRTSTLLRKLRTGRSPADVAAEFHKWHHADTDGDGKAEDVEGLKRRRTAEAELFLAPVAPMRQVTS